MRIGFLQFDAAGTSGDHPIKNLLVHPACYPTQVGCSTDVPSYDYDIERAKELMIEAGYPNGFDLEMHYYRDTNLAEVMAKDQQVNDWLAIGDGTIDLTTREDAYQKALSRISDQAYWLSLWTYSYNYAFAKYLDFTPAADEIPRFFTSSWK